jgi:hypothetical protein
LLVSTLHKLQGWRRHEPARVFNRDALASAAATAVLPGLLLEGRCLQAGNESKNIVKNVVECAPCGPGLGFTRAPQGPNVYGTS